MKEKRGLAQKRRMSQAVWLLSLVLEDAEEEMGSGSRALLSRALKSGSAF